MDNGLKVRRILFENLLNEGDNRKNWEKLCCSDRPLVPFVGAGISAWCYPTWNKLLIGIVEEIYSHQCAEIVQQALACEKKPNVEMSEEFHWMEEIAECIFETNSKYYDRYIQKFKHNVQDYKETEDLILHKLRSYVGDEGKNKKREAEKALYRAFDESVLKEKGKIPEYQHLFCRLFKDVLVTTNYDKALESCYASILSYSYMDLKKKNKGEDGEKKKSWLFRAIISKLAASRQKLEGKENLTSEVTVPEMPMLLKVHGSIEQANKIALSWSGYRKAYKGEMPELFQEITKRSTIVFLGCGMRDDRILAQLDNVIEESDLFAILPKWEDDEEKEGREQRNLLAKRHIYPIYYDKKMLDGIMLNDMQAGNDYHDFFLGLLLENLARRRTFYPKALEELWDEGRFDKNTSQEEYKGGGNNENDSTLKIYKRQILELNEKAKREWLKEGDPQYVHREQALQIWDVLNTSAECPLIAITGEVGAGKSFLCKSIQELHKSYKDTMQFFYISVSDCGSWEELCIRIYEGLNIMAVEIPEETQWRTVAERVAERCGGYWKSVLILDHVESIQETDGKSTLWETTKNIFRYWKDNHTRVIFTCRTYPIGVSCYTWQIERLQKDEAWKVFYSACQCMRYKRVSRQEQGVVNALFEKYEFQTSEVDLLGKYANSKSNLSSLMEEWKLFYKSGDEVAQTLARIMWNNLLDEHCYADQDSLSKKNIKRNILWIWGILGKYPGNFPHQFFEAVLEDEVDYKNKQLSEKTLRYMKNCGLCEILLDERQNNVLENMITCVEESFVNILDDGLKARFRKHKKSFHNQGKGMEWFRGYHMRDYEKSLRRFIVEEEQEIERDEEIHVEGVKDILDFLNILGEKVTDGATRTQHEALNLILHYEVKTIIRFLQACLINEKKSEEETEQILEIGFQFSSYYHYVPNYAYSFVKQILKMIEKREGVGNIICKANMHKVMGDVERLLGMKEEAIKSYEKALGLCDSSMLLGFTKDTEDRNKEEDNLYNKSLHIKAGILLAGTYYGMEDGASEEARRIYEQLNEQQGLAYFNQRTAEIKLAEFSGKNLSNGKEIKNFDSIKKYFLDALRLYQCNKDATRIAYMLKCIGDLIIEFREVIGENDNVIYDIDNATLEIGGTGTGVSWSYAASDYYLEAFIRYCRHINWRGLANVIQAMGTCIRYMYRENGGLIHKDVKNMYGLAEECYRWISDVRGLADTLDYSGHYYDKEIQDEAEKILYKYKALSKWKESRKVWEQQGNSEKARQTEQEIKRLEQEIKELERNDKKEKRENLEGTAKSTGVQQEGH